MVTIAHFVPHNVSKMCTPKQNITFYYNKMHFFQRHIQLYLNSFHRFIRFNLFPSDQTYIQSIYCPEFFNIFCFLYTKMSLSHIILVINQNAWYILLHLIQFIYVKEFHTKSTDTLHPCFINVFTDDTNFLIFNR